MISIYIFMASLLLLYYGKMIQSEYSVYCFFRKQKICYVFGHNEVAVCLFRAIILFQNIKFEKNNIVNNYEVQKIYANCFVH